MNEYHFFPMSGRPLCPDCKAPLGVKLTVGETGFSVTEGYEHQEDCPKLRCPHGILWTQECDECEMDREVYANE